MSNKEENTFKDVYQTILNGRTSFSESAKNPLGRKEVRYYNPQTDKMQTQNYLEMQDLVVPIILKRSEDGTVMFAMQYEYIPAINKVTLELPDCPFFYEKKDRYTVSDATDCIDKRMHELGMEMIGFKYLDSAETPVSQSFTDQTAKIATVHVEEIAKNENLQWFPISSIEDYLKVIGEDSSLQTQYALQLFQDEFKKEIGNGVTSKFVYDKQFMKENAGKWKDEKNIMPHKYRFGIELSEKVEENEERSNISDLGDVAEYGQSKNSVQCLVVKKIGNKIKVGLSKQQRSPFINRPEIGEFFYEAAAGMVEPGESYEQAARRETIEETGIGGENSRGKLIHLSNPTLLSKATEEYSDFYIYETDESEKAGNQSLDNEENIEKIEWFDLDEINVEKIKSPMPTKYLIIKAKEYYAKEKKKEKIQGMEK